MDLDFRKTTEKMFFVLHDGKIYITINGLTFADVIYSATFADPFAGVNKYSLFVDETYSEPMYLQIPKLKVLAHSISDRLAE